MPIRFHCSECGAGFKADNQQAGRALPCPRCGASIEIPLAEASLPEPFDPLEETDSESGETQVIPPAPKRAKPAPPAPPAPTPARPKEAPPPLVEEPPAQVRIVDVSLPMRTVLALVVRFTLAGALVGAVVLAVVAGILALLAWFGVRVPGM